MAAHWRVLWTGKEPLGTGRAALCRGAGWVAEGGPVSRRGERGRAAYIRLRQTRAAWLGWAAPVRRGPRNELTSPELPAVTPSCMRAQSRGGGGGMTERAGGARGRVGDGKRYDRKRYSERASTPTHFHRTTCVKPHLSKIAATMGRSQ